MKFYNSLLLGSAAALSAIAGANAADLPSRKAAPVNYVKICDAYGAGYFFIPGTDTCLKVGGRVRTEFTFISASNAVGVGANQFAAAGAALSTVRPTFQVASGAQDTTGTLVRGSIYLDARTPTAFGTVRTNIGLRAQNSSGIYQANALGGAFTAGTGTNITIENAYVQWAGFTFGRAAENFVFMPSANYTVHSWADYSSGINQLAYTATFGGGFSATLAFEDRAGLAYSLAPNGMMRQVTPVGVPAGVLVPGSAIARVASGPMELPALVGNIRLDQSWGSLALMGAVMRNNAAVTSSLVANAAVGSVTPFNGTVLATPTVDPLNATLGGSVVSRTGWALGAGVKLNLPMLAAGDVLYLTAAYADGALDFLSTINTSARSGIGREFGGLIRQDRNLTVFPTSICAPAGGNGNAVCSVGSESTKAWAVGGIFTHYWTSQIRQNVMASYLSLTPGAVTRNTDWQFGGLSKGSLTLIGTSFIYSPVKDFDIGLEVTYGRIQQSLASFPGLAPSTTGGGTGAAILPFKVSPSMVETRLRIQRTF